MKRSTAITTAVAFFLAGTFMAIPSSHGLLAAPESSFIAYFPVLMQSGQTVAMATAVTAIWTTFTCGTAIASIA